MEQGPPRRATRFERRVTRAVPTGPELHTDASHFLKSIKRQVVLGPQLPHPGLIQALFGLCSALIGLPSPSAERSMNEA